MGSKVNRGGLMTVGEALGLAAKAAGKEPFCNNPKCQYHRHKVEPGTLQLEVFKPGAIIGSVRRELVKRATFQDPGTGRVAYFCEVCELAIDVAYKVLGGEPIPEADPMVEAPGEDVRAVDPHEKRPHSSYLCDGCEIPCVLDTGGKPFDLASAHCYMDGCMTGTRFKRLDLSDVEMQKLPEN